MMKTNLTALLVDDEQSALDNLRYLLEQFCPEVTIVGEATHVDEAIEKIKKLSPTLVFLDIEMPQKNGFELLEAFDSIDFTFIFVTAYNHYAIKAFEVSAIDYLLKPIEIERLKSAIEKVGKQTRIAKKLALLKNTITDKKVNKLAIPYKKDFIIICTECIVCIEADRMYSKIHAVDPATQQAKEYVYSKKLGELENLLDSTIFVRTHRSWIANPSYLKTYSKKKNSLQLEHGFEIPISKSYKASVEEKILS